MHCSKWCGTSIQDNIIICPQCKANQNADNTNATNQNFLNPNMINEIYQITQNVCAMRKDINFIKRCFCFNDNWCCITFSFFNSL